MAGAKGKIIERFTHLSHRKMRAMYRALRDMAPPAGPIMQGSARYFAMPSKRTSTSWSIQCAIFQGCYERVSRITPTPLQRGWLLLAAFNSYLSITDKLHQTTGIKRLDINQAYALLSYCAFMSSSADAELQRKLCPVCSIPYPVVANELPDGQACPVCAINANSQRLAGQECPLEDANTSPQTQ